MENKKIRISNDIVIKATVTRLSQPEVFEGKNAKLLLCGGGETKSLPYSLDGNVMTAVFWGSEQHRIGTYSIKVVEAAGKKSTNAADKMNIFTLVPNSESQKEGATGEQTIAVNIDISVPSNGLSTYELAVINGFEGSEEEFLVSLKGGDGASAYQVWLNNGREGSEADFLNSLRGEAGSSAYEEWLALGNSGTEEAFIASLKGTPGTPGSDGHDGIDGNLIYPTYFVDTQMHLKVKSDVDTERIRINEKNHLTINI